MRSLPGLGVAVIEVKGYALQRDSRSGDWNTLSHDEPYGQVRAEMKSLLARWSHILPGQPAFFDCFLALPFTPVDTDLDNYRGIPRRHILAANELDLQPSSFAPLRIEAWMSHPSAMAWLRQQL